MASYAGNINRSSGKVTSENQGFVRELQPGMEEELLPFSDGSSLRPSEIAPLQLESHNLHERSSKANQEGLKVIIGSSICFAVSVTIALILTIYLAPPQVPRHAGVVSDTKICSEVGKGLLERGGSAVDAAVAVVLCEGIVNPQHSGIGGGGFMLVRRSKESTTDVIDFMDSTPADFKITSDMSEAGKLVGIPGMLRGLELAHQKFGKLRWLDVIMSVVEIAYSPINVSQELSEELNIMVKNPQYQNIAEYFISNRRSTGKNQMIMNMTKIGWVLQAVASEGTDAFYENAIAQDIVKTVQRNGGVLSLSDLKNYRATERKPAATTFLGMTVESAPLPSGGPFLLLFLNIIENLTTDGIIPFNATDFDHVVIEALKFTYNQQSLLKDNNFNNATSILISEDFAAFISAKLDLDRTHNERSFYSSGDFYRDGGHGTTHVSVIDPDDIMVSVTASLYGPFGSGLMTDSGVILNSHMLHSYDLPPQDVNIFPTSMTPVIIYNSSRPCGRRYAMGGADGDMLIAGLVEVILNIFGHGMELELAIDAPRVYVQMNDTADEIQYEANFSPDVLNMLKDKGHVAFEQITSRNRVYAVAKINETVYGHADRRSTGQAVVY